MGGGGRGREVDMKRAIESPEFFTDIFFVLRITWLCCVVGPSLGMYLGP